MSVFIVFGHLFTAATAGYAFARLRFPGRDKVFILFLANLMVPVIVLHAVPVLKPTVSQRERKVRDLFKFMVGL